MAAAPYIPYIYIHIYIYKPYIYIAYIYLYTLYIYIYLIHIYIYLIYICIYIQYKLGKNNTHEVYYSEFHVENNLQVYI